MERHADICGRPAVALAAVTVERGGVRIGGVLYGSSELDRRIEAAAGPLVASATVYPDGGGTALVLLHDTFEVVRVDAVVSPAEFDRHLRTLDAVLKGAADILRGDK